MKQTILSFLLALLPLAASADAVEINGIYYNLITKGKIAEVTSNPNKYTGTVVIPETVTYNDVTYSVTGIGSSAFINCIGLTSITIPKSMTNIGFSAFYGCSGLTSITIPNFVTTIGSLAFAGCTSLTSVNISDLAAWCNIKFEGNLSNPLIYAQSLYLNGEKVIHLIIPNSVTCIKNYTFSGCSGLTSITIPNSVTSIELYAFQNCSSLMNITIPNSVTSIGEFAFENCSGLMSITIPNSVTSVERSVFSGCSGLTSITIPNSVTSIGNGAFEGCTSLTSTTIPNSVYFIGNYAFSSCTQLTDVYCYAETVPLTYSNVFDGSYINYATLHVPESAIESYKAKDPWSGFQKIVSIESSGLLNIPIGDMKHEDAASEVFDLQGRRVEKSQRGLFIHNGKKVIIKYH